MQLVLERFAYYIQAKAILAQVKMHFQDIEAFEEFKSCSRLSNISRLDCSLLADIQVLPRCEHLSLVHLVNVQEDLDSKGRPRLAESPEMSIRCSSGTSLVTSSSTLSSKPSSAGGGAPTPEWDNNFMDWVTYEKVTTLWSRCQVHLSSICH